MQEDDGINKFVEANDAEEEDGSGSESGIFEGGGADPGEDTGGDETAGSAVGGGASSGDSGKGSDQVGDTQGVNAGESETVEVYEGVASDDFEEFEAWLEVRVDSLIASSTVILIAMFVCIGIMAVQQIADSLKGR